MTPDSRCGCGEGDEGFDDNRKTAGPDRGDVERAKKQTTGGIYCAPFLDAGASSRRVEISSKILILPDFRR